MILCLTLVFIAKLDLRADSYAAPGLTDSDKFVIEPLSGHNKWTLLSLKS